MIYFTRAALLLAIALVVGFGTERAKWPPGELAPVDVYLSNGAAIVAAPEMTVAQAPAGAAIAEVEIAEVGTGEKVGVSQGRGMRSGDQQKRWRAWNC